MRIESKLCHLSENKAVVQVNGWLNGQKVGSALAEGSTVDHAEDNAILRLNKRLNIKDNNELIMDKKYEHKLNNQVKVELPKREKIENVNKNIEPSDWSNELAAIDLEIDRLNWTRDDEIKFLIKNLGYNNRNKITRYSEIVNYLTLLKETDNSTLVKSNKSNRKTLIEQSDNILRDLSWDNKKGREYLQKEFNVSTRNELDENQLILFVAKLKSIRNQHLSP